MKKFEEFCYMTQQGVKEYMFQYLTSKKYDVVDEDGFLYAKGDVPVLLVAHMDTVHKELCTQILKSGDALYSNQGIGGDDRCGIFIIANLVKKHHCSVVLLEDEEIGTVGARKFAQTEYIKNLDVNFMIEFDRKGRDDAVFYSCDNKEFTKHVLDNTGYKQQVGSFTDISVLMPASKLCGVNLSCGYYNPHTTNEFVIYKEMFETIAAAEELITAKCEKPFEYVAKNYASNYSYNKSYNSSRYDYDDYYGYDSYGGYYKGNSYGVNNNNKNDDLPTRASKDITLELIVTVIGKDKQQEFRFASGNTKSECWLDLFTAYPSMCFNDIIEYEFE